jgi:hypothetical protein
MRSKRLSSYPSATSIVIWSCLWIVCRQSARVGRCPVGIILY